MSATIKECGCGATYDVDAWLALPGSGRMDLGDGEAIDLRHCVCKSTISVLVSDLREDDRLAFELRRMEKIARLVEGAERATDLALTFAAEERLAGRRPSADHRVLGATRQAAEYLRAVDRLRAMRFDSDDLVLATTMSEQLAAAE